MKTFINGGEVKKMFIAGNEVKSLFKNGVKVYENTLNDGLILDLPLQNNFTDTTGINTMIAGGTSNLPTFTLEGGEYAATFNGSQSLKTNANFVIGTDKVSISFWMKTSQTGIAVLQEISSNSDNKNAFAIAINVEATNKFSMQNKKASSGIYNAVYSTSIINQNSWHHVCVVSDRYLNGNNESKIYVDNVLANVVFNNFDSSGNYINDILFIGQRGGSSYGFNGQMKFLKIFNYPLSQTEITNLYNSEL